MNDKFYESIRKRHIYGQTKDKGLKRMKKMVHFVRELKPLLNTALTLGSNIIGLLGREMKYQAKEFEKNNTNP